MVIALTSEAGNHSPDRWALATAQTIFDIDPAIDAGRLLAAHAIQNQIAIVLSAIYGEIIALEAYDLQAFFDHCDTPYGVDQTAMAAVFQIRDILKTTPWADKAQDPQWVEDAARTIQTHLETALHVERLLYADANPTNPSAVAYRARFHGAS